MKSLKKLTSLAHFVRKPLEGKMNKERESLGFEYKSSLNEHPWMVAGYQV